MIKQPNAPDRYSAGDADPRPPRLRQTWPWTLVIGMAMLFFAMFSGFLSDEPTPIQVLSFPIGFVLSTVGMILKVRGDARIRRAARD